MGESAEAGAAKKAATRTAGFKVPLIAAAGGVATAALLVAMLGRGPVAGGHSQLSMVAQSEITAAAATLAPESSAQTAAEAKSCKVPMAYVTISKQADSRGGTIRIKSGAYVSPPFQVTDTPQRVAIPYPAPYPAGKGLLAVEGEASGIIVSIYPNWRIEVLHGLKTLDVWWATDKPC
jgi:hypothetical protein